MNNNSYYVRHKETGSTAFYSFLHRLLLLKKTTTMAAASTAPDAAIPEGVSIALPISELQPSKFMLSKKETKKWDFFNKQQNKQMIGSHDWVEVYYDTPGQKLAFVVENVKTMTGVQTGNNFKKGFMSVTLTPEQSAAIRAAVDAPIFQLVWQNREDLYKKGRKMTQPLEMKFAFKGVVQDGKEKKDKDGNFQKGPDGKVQVWQDSITGNIAMKKKNNQVVVDENVCQIVDLTDRPYAWTGLAGKKIREIVFEVDRVVFAESVVVHIDIKCVVPDEVGTGGTRYLTKRRLEVPAAAPAASTEQPSAAAPAGASSSSPPEQGTTKQVEVTASSPAATPEPPQQPAGKKQRSS